MIGIVNNFNNLQRYPGKVVFFDNGSKNGFRTSKFFSVPLRETGNIGYKPVISVF